MKNIYKILLYSLGGIFLMSSFYACCMKKTIEIDKKKLDKKICPKIVKKTLIYKTHEDFIDNKNYIKNYAKQILEEDLDYLIHFKNIKAFKTLIEKKLKKEPQKSVPVACHFSKKKLIFDITKKNYKMFKKQFCEAIKKEYIDLVKTRNKKIILPIRFSTTVSFFKPPIEILRILLALLIKEPYRFITEKKIATKSLIDASKVLYLQILKILVSIQLNKFDSIAKNMELKSWIASICYFIIYWYSSIRKGYRLPYFKSKMQEVPPSIKKVGHLSLKALTYYIFTKIPIDYAQKFLEEYTGTSKVKLNKKISNLNKKIEKIICATNQ